MLFKTHQNNLRQWRWFTCVPIIGSHSATTILYHTDLVSYTIIAFTNQWMLQHNFEQWYILWFIQPESKLFTIKECFSQNTNIMKLNNFNWKNHSINIYRDSLDMSRSGCRNSSNLPEYISCWRMSHWPVDKWPVY
jgi:hypothetical protein